MPGKQVSGTWHARHTSKRARHCPAQTLTTKPCPGCAQTLTTKPCPDCAQTQPAKPSAQAVPKPSLPSPLPRLCLKPDRSAQQQPGGAWPFSPEAGPRKDAEKEADKNTDKDTNKDAKLKLLQGCCLLRAWGACFVGCPHCAPTHPNTP